MKNAFTIVCRGSWLSLAQVEVFTQKLKSLFPGTEASITIRQTEGDKNQSTPLHEVESKDFFTKDIQDFLKSGAADFAVHSMKDISGEDFFSETEYAVVDRDDIRDVAIFSESIIEKLQQGSLLRIGASSPRRSIMAVDFLQKALPWLGTAPRVQVQATRGDVEKRLRKLHEGKYDGLILSAAGLNRLLRYAPATAAITDLLRYKKIMLLPLFECPPAAGQGAIVVEAVKSNPDAVQVLGAVNNMALKKAIQEERRFAGKHSYPGHLGVFHCHAAHPAFTFAAGRDEFDEAFEDWNFTVDQLQPRQPVFSAVDNMKHFFQHQPLPNVQVDAEAKAIFVAGHRAVHDTRLVQQCKTKRIWAAGVKTWLSLAQKGIWVEGCADGMGMEVLEPVWQAPLFHLPAAQIRVLTNAENIAHCGQDGWQALATYQLLPALDKKMQQEISAAGAIFWSTYQQYELCRPFLHKKVIHICTGGKTAVLLQAAGLQPVIFPTIKAYQQWKQPAVPLRSTA